MFSENKNFTQK